MLESVQWYYFHYCLTLWMYDHAKITPVFWVDGTLSIIVIIIITIINIKFI